MKNYNQAPLPFQGQKRRFLTKFKQALNSFPDEAMYIDVFGGSGLLSHCTKVAKPNAVVIWNDFDDYKKRLDNIHTTNLLLHKLRELLSSYGKKQKISETDKIRVLELLKSHQDKHGYLDYITISSNLLFSSKYATNYDEMNQGFYNKVRLSDYNCADYLKGVERISMDYKEVHTKYQSDNVIWLLDPPYLSTDTSTYSNKDYWKLRDYLDILNLLDGSSYFYFTSNKSQIVELCEWVETRTFTGNPFAGSITDTTVGTLNYNSSYTDIMIFKNKK